MKRDLARALREGTLSGAALDVLSQEPPAAGNPLLDAPGCLITPTTHGLGEPVCTSSNCGDYCRECKSFP